MGCCASSPAAEPTATGKADPLTPAGKATEPPTPEVASPPEEPTTPPVTAAVTAAAPSAAPSATAPEQISLAAAAPQPETSAKEGSAGLQALAVPAAAPPPAVAEPSQQREQSQQPKSEKTGGGRRAARLKRDLNNALQRSFTNIMKGGDAGNNSRDSNADSNVTFVTAG